jgi:hypothetical protein
MDAVDGVGKHASQLLACIDARVDVEGAALPAVGERGRPRAASCSPSRQLFRRVLGNHLDVRHRPENGREGGGANSSARSWWRRGAVAGAPWGWGRERSKELFDLN